MVNPVSGPGGLPPAAKFDTEAVPDDEDFSNILTESLDSARQAEATADDLGERFAAGDPTVGIHEMMIAAERANVSLRYAVTLKNKAVEAYRDLMNTPL
ncbi:MAG: flagellar hook-basal body complex protein FliE [Nannocystales bacterium]